MLLTKTGSETGKFGTVYDLGYEFNCYKKKLNRQWFMWEFMVAVLKR